MLGSNWCQTRQVAAQLIREHIYLYGAVCPKDGRCVYLIMPASDTACFQIYLDVLSKKYRRQQILLVLDGAPNHQSSGPGQHLASVLATLICRSLILRRTSGTKSEKKVFKNFALKSMNAVRAKLRDAVLYIERNPDLVKSITTFPYIAKSI